MKQEDTQEHLSKYALKQKRLREERNFGNEYTIGDNAEEPNTKVETIAEVAQKLSEKMERKKKFSMTDVMEGYENDIQHSHSDRYNGLSNAERQRLIEKWTKETENHQKRISEFQSKIGKLQNQIKQYNLLIKRNNKRIEDIKKNM